MAEQAGPSDPRVTEAAAAKAQAEARKAEAEAAVAARAAAFPAAAIKPADVKPDIGDKSGYPAALVAYQALEAVAWEIAGVVNDRLSASDAEGKPAAITVLLVEAPDLAAASLPLLDIRARLPYWTQELQRYSGVFAGYVKAYESELAAAAAKEVAEQHRTAFTDILKDLKLDEAQLNVLVDRSVAAAGAVAAVGGLAAALGPAAALPAMVLPAAVSAVGQVADVLSYLQSAVTLRPTAVSADDLALRASIAAKLVAPKVYLQDFWLVAKAPVVNDVTGLVTLRATVEQAAQRAGATAIAAVHALVKAAQGRVDEAAKLLDAAAEAERPALRQRLATARRDLAAAQAKALPMDADVAGWGSLASAFEAWVKGLATAESDGWSPLAQAALWEHASDLGVTHVLYAKVVSSGGEQQLRQSRLPWVGQRVNYLGGVAAAYLLAAADGALVASGSHRALSHLEFDIDAGRPSGGGGRFDLRPLANPDLG